MPKVIGLLCALAALAASVLAKADPTTALLRAVLAYFAGALLTQVWYVFFATQVQVNRASDDEDQAA